MSLNSESLGAWVLEALTELGGSGSVIEVSRVIWRRHEPQLRESGDLFYTWQYDLRRAAQKLRDSGALEKSVNRRSREWTIATRVKSNGRADVWSHQEIDVAVDAYFRMLRSEIEHKPYSKTEENARVVALTGRSRGSVEFKFANISAALEALGEPYIGGYKPRANAQAALREAVTTYLASGSASDYL